MKTRDIAIIGIAGRFPGADSIKEFWENLCAGKESIHFFTDDELLAAGVDEATLKNPLYVKAAPMLNNIDLFDAPFFKFSPREAEALDPQQRILLECAWHAFEDAGYVPQDISARVGVYVGSGGGMTSYLLHYLDVHPEIRGASASVPHLGNDKDFPATRISYKLNLKGPSIGVQTACSTSLVSVHLACQSILDGECEMALAGGINIRVPHVAGYFRQDGDIFSHDGHCRVFDAKATGTLFGSGVGLILLKPLEKALQDNDNIYAVIKGSAINNDGGNKLSYAASSFAGQVQCIESAIRAANISPETIHYIEAHGTATEMGDPVEISALTTVFRKYTEHKNFCGLGSVKANVGHLDTASGIAGLIKTILSLYYKKIPPAILFDTPNSKINFPDSPFYVNASLSHWENKKNTPRRAAVNSLGIGGTNAFMILEEAPERKVNPITNKSYYLVTLSAKHETSLKQRLEDLKNYLKKYPHENLEAISYTLNITRSHFKHRYAVVASNTTELYELLDGKQAVSASIPYKNELEQVAARYRAGEDIDWNKLHEGEAHQKISLPMYPFLKERHWVSKNKIEKNDSDLFYGERWEEIDLPENDKNYLNKKGIVIAENTKKIKLSALFEETQYIDFEAVSEFTSVLSKAECVVLVLSFHKHSRKVFQYVEYYLQQFLMIAKLIPRSSEFILLTEWAQHLPEDKNVDLIAAPLIGFLKSWILECPGRQFRHIDINASKALNLTPMLLQVSALPPEEIFVARRGMRYFGLRVEKEKLIEQKTFKLKPEKTYLITGGLGEIGLALTDWLINEGAKHIVLTSRRKPNAEIENKITRWKERGVEVIVYSADITQEMSIKKLIKSIQASSYVLAGIFHLAGIISDTLVENMTSAQLEEVLAPKVKGAWYLHCHTKDLPLDYFVLFSSATSFLGNVGQANYAAANAFLDALSYYRALQYLPSQTINWDAWEIGMWHRLDEKLKQNIKPLGTHEALQKLKIIMQSHKNHVAVIKREATTPFTNLPDIKTGVLIHLLEKTSSEKKEALLIENIRNLIAETTGLPLDAIEETRDFFEMGIDSIMGIQVRDKLYLGFDKKIDIPNGLLVRVSNIKDLSQELLKLYDQYIASSL